MTVLTFILQKFRLTCSIPVNFSFRIDVTKPHPYYRIAPLDGIIPANGGVDVTLTFNPITLGSCMITIMLTVEQYGFTPIECVISARAVSGLLEHKELTRAEDRLFEHVVNHGTRLNNFLGESTFKGDLALKSMRPTQTTNNTTSKFGSTKLLEATKFKKHFHDPTALMLAKTFHATDLNTALDGAIRDTKILGEKNPDGSLKILDSVRPRGPGAGTAFDAGSQWISLQQKQLQQSQDRGKVVASMGEDKIVGGLRVPAFLDNNASVNFVLTQEAGKLKPKDLKIAIEKSRALRELKAQEQKKIRDEGGEVGMLDLRGLLAEERLNMNGAGDPFKRQLRELAFLQDVDDVNKLEIEKGFRVSEEFLGAPLLSDDDVKVGAMGSGPIY